MYIKPNTTAEVVCAYKENQKAPIIWRNSNKIIGYGNIVGDKEGKFTISNNNGTGKSMLEIVNFSVRDEDMYRCDGVHDNKIVEICFNIHMCSK